MIESLDKAPIFYEVFLQKFLMWLLKVSLSSIVTPSTFCSLLFFITQPLKIKVSFLVSFSRHSSNFLPLPG